MNAIAYGPEIRTVEACFIADFIEHLLDVSPSETGKADAPKIIAKPQGSERSDQEVIERIRASKQKEKFAALFDRGDFAAYPGQSEADLALLDVIGWACGWRPDQMERIFSAGALGQRSKWQNRPDYRQRSIRKALIKTPDHAAQEDSGPHPLAQFRPRPGDVPPEPGFILRGILCDKVSFIGAYAGAGKTTAVAPLVLIAAGVLKVPGIDIYSWRPVVYISEHPEQLEMIVNALIRYHGLDADLVWQRVKIVQAVKMTAEAVAKVAPDYRALTVTHTENGITADFPPWVIVDTQSALFAVENENDNAEMGRIVATIKQQMDLPVSVIAHTAKIHKHADIKTISIRGGGALEGDANQVLYVSIDAQTEQRFIEIAAPKHRFVPAWDALALTYHVMDMPASDPFGRQITMPVGFCTVEPVAKSARVERKEEAAEERKREAIKDAREAILARVIECQKLAEASPDDADYYPTKRSLTSALEHPREAVRKAVDELLSEKRIAVARRPKEAGKTGPRDYFVPVKPGGAVGAVTDIEDEAA